jgi:hypothetical protein
MVHHEGCGQEKQRLDRQERHLSSALNRAARQERLELLAGLADRQLQIISQVSPAVAVRLPGPLNRPCYLWRLPTRSVRGVAASHRL